MRVLVLMKCSAERILTKTVPKLSKKNKIKKYSRLVGFRCIKLELRTAASNIHYITLSLEMYSAFLDHSHLTTHLLSAKNSQCKVPSKYSASRKSGSSQINMATERWRKGTVEALQTPFIYIELY